MANDDHTDPYEAAAASLRAKEVRLVTELQAVRTSLASIEAARAASGFRGTASSGFVSSSAPDTVIGALLEPDKYKGMGLETASAKCLSDSDHIELTAKQIWTALARAGFTLLSDRPEQSVSWALRKRERKVGDVILVGDGKWGMVAWYSQARLRDLRAARNNASGRNHVEHVEKTKAGIANARKTRLNKWGPRRKITGEQMAAAYAEFQRGARSKLQLSNAAKMAYPTFNLYWGTYELENWRPGDPFPPARRAVFKPQTTIRLENMWPREKGHANGHAKDDGPQLSLQPAE